jgi:hypothetical protein
MIITGTSRRTEQRNCISYDSKQQHGGFDDGESQKKMAASFYDSSANLRRTEKQWS